MQFQKMIFIKPYIYRWKISVPLSERENIYLAYVLSRAALEKIQYSSFRKPGISYAKLAQRPPEGYPMPSRPLQPTFCALPTLIPYCGTKHVLEGHTALLSHTPSCLLSTSHRLASTCVFRFYFQPFLITSAIKQVFSVLAY